MSEKAGRRIRTDDLLITNQLLYQLSYAGKMRRTLLHLRRRDKASRFGGVNKPRAVRWFPES
jgi:hypothetical protein